MVNQIFEALTLRDEERLRAFSAKTGYLVQLSMISAENDEPHNAVPLRCILYSIMDTA